MARTLWQPNRILRSAHIRRDLKVCLGGAVPSPNDPNLDRVAPIAEAACFDIKAILESLIERVIVHL